MEGVILAFDFGLKRIGVAVGNTLLKKAQPLTIIKEETNVNRFQAIEAIIAEWKPIQLIVGLPFHPDGAEHDMTKRCRRFANQLQGRFNIATIPVDERFSSSVLNFKQGRADDAHAAALILQQYFDEQTT